MNGVESRVPYTSTVERAYFKMRNIVSGVVTSKPSILLQQLNYNCLQPT
jgi:hypothetical protein